jgi:hypothetical protein
MKANKRTTSNSSHSLFQRAISNKMQRGFISSESVIFGFAMDGIVSILKSFWLEALGFNALVISILLAVKYHVRRSRSSYLDFQNIHPDGDFTVQPRVRPHCKPPDKRQKWNALFCLITNVALQSEANRDSENY